MTNSPQAIDAVVGQLRTLRLPYMRRAAPELLKDRQVAALGSGRSR